MTSKEINEEKLASKDNESAERLKKFEKEKDGRANELEEKRFLDEKTIKNSSMELKDANEKSKVVKNNLWMRARDLHQRVDRIFECEMRAAMERAEASASDEFRENFDDFSREIASVERNGCFLFEKNEARQCI